MPLDLELGWSTSQQIEFGSTEQPRRNTTLHKSPEPVVDIKETWVHKGRAPCPLPITLDATHERLFIPLSPLVGGNPCTLNPNSSRPPRMERTQKLRELEQRGRKFNLINGQYEGEEKWKGPLLR